jgi:hypothetical protein
MITITPYLANALPSYSGKPLAPFMDAPPCSHTMTGKRLDIAERER